MHNEAQMPKRRRKCEQKVTCAMSDVTSTSIFSDFPRDVASSSAIGVRLELRDQDASVGLAHTVDDHEPRWAGGVCARVRMQVRVRDNGADNCMDYGRRRTCMPRRASRKGLLTDSSKTGSALRALPVVILLPGTREDCSAPARSSAEVIGRSIVSRV